MTFVRFIVPWIVLLFIAIGVLYPNPFSNNPDVIFDESYFLSSSLAAIQGHTLPGWVRTPSTTYYGGPQTYVDTAALIPVLGTVVAANHFSMMRAEFWVAQHTGDLLHILRLVNGAVALLALVCCFIYARRRKIPAPLARSLSLFLFLLLSNVLVIEFLHTAKMWPFYIIFVAVTSAVFLAQEYYARFLKTSFISKKTYVAILLWSGALTFFQSYFGLFSIVLITLYALLLRHIDLTDLWAHVRRYWYLFVALALTQVSFLYQAFAISHQLGDASIKTAGGTIDWIARLWMPLVYVVEGQPLSLLYPIGLIALIALAFFNRSFFADSRRHAILMIAAIHPVLVYLFFYLIVGLDLLPRYGIVLTIACSFATVLLMTELGIRWVVGALVASALLFAVIDMHAIAFYWHPSSETTLLDTIEANYNTPTTVFITDHSARRMTLPVNSLSLQFLDAERQQMSRFSFLLQHQDLLAPDTSFKPIVMTAYLPDEQAADIARFATSTDSVWIISSDCTNLCKAVETVANSCFEINTSACGYEPQEVNTLPVFLSSDQLGYSYIVRRIH